jgi:hypothetical protein
MPGARATELLARVERTWRPLRDTADALGSDALERATPAEWTAKEMLAHVAFWEEAVEGAVRARFRGEDMSRWTFGSGWSPGDDPWPRADVHNAREAAWARAQPASAVLARLDRAHAGMVAFLTTVPDDEIAAHEAYFAEIGDHFTEHLPELEALLPAT